ncbi:MAG: Hsp33 family molecular chaperone HslO [Alphaproteobacteria bacterium]|nr:Hsp33 family molecular chaperone HslO [Alphaproteobacteria bacterium]
MNDKCISFNLDNNAFRGRIVRLDNVLQDIFSHWVYPDNIASAVAETTALGVLLASLMKFDGLFTLQMQGNGPLSLLVTDVTSDGKVRSCAKYDAEAIKKAQELRKTEGVIEPTPHWLGQGNLIFTIDQGPKTELYQGVVDLQGKNLAECALRYFKNSEQIDTHLQLFVQKNENGNWQAGGILIQKMPTAGGVDAADAEDMAEVWNEDKILLDSLKQEEIFDADLSLEDILFRLFHEHNVRVVKNSAYLFGCRCNREKLLNTLSSMKQEDIDDMLENGKITATCNFCGQIYSFEKSELLKH